MTKVNRLIVALIQSDTYMWLLLITGAQLSHEVAARLTTIQTLLLLIISRLLSPLVLYPFVILHLKF